MKFFASVLVFVVIQLASAGLIEKRASINDVATVGYAAGTTGGSGGTQTTVTTLNALTAAVQGNAKKIVVISAEPGNISGDAVVEIGSNTSILGRQGSSLTGIGLRVLGQSNVIIRNVKIAKVLAPGDNIGIQSSSKVWVDHCDLSSDRDHDEDFYGGLLVITHGCTGITVSNCKLYTHWKACLVGDSDSNGAEDVSITVTFVGNWWFNLNSRIPFIRFGHCHIFNNIFDDNDDGCNTSDGAQLLVENNVWTDIVKPLYSTDGGFAVAHGNDFGGASIIALNGNFTVPPYPYALTPVGVVRPPVTASAGQTLIF